jgi:SAM-dependent methyltransferase
VGVDSSEAMLAVARAKRPGLDLRLAPITALPFSEGSFDLAVIALVLEHLPDIEAPIAELARVLKPGGRVVLSMFHPFFLLKGIPPHFAHADHGVEYQLPGYAHLPCRYFSALRDTGLELDALIEPLVDQALVAELPSFSKHAGWPLALIAAASLRDGG